MGTGLLLAAVLLLALAGLLILAHEDAGAAETPEAPAPRRQTPPAPLPDGLTPREFERHCADLLAARGWTVTLGRGSADQGVDVLARKGGRSVVLQCKLHARPIGNKAVQEALAGRGYAGADSAAVVSNSAYTPAARALASRVGVLLLHVSDLPRADALFRRAAPSEPAPTRPAHRARRPAPRLRRLRGGLIPAALLAGAILLLPHRPDPAPETPRLERAAARSPLPLPLPAPPGPGRRTAG